MVFQSSMSQENQGVTFLVVHPRMFLPNIVGFKVSLGFRLGYVS
jgi:hypothetical protein